MFREGLACILVLAVSCRRPEGSGEKTRTAGIAFAATLMTWFIAVHILNVVSQRMPAFAVQAATGLLAIFILLVLMNWFFHKLYGTGWISLHNQRKREMLEKKRNGKLVDAR